ncbi:MAG: divergent polysaccharide deacetylase family protein [Halioglobus sp.]
MQPPRTQANPSKASRFAIRVAAAVAFCLVPTLGFAQPATATGPLSTKQQALEAIPAIGPQAAQLVIIIDDLGHELRRGTLATELPGNITLAVLPYTRHGDHLARVGHQAGKEIMLHAPMSTLNDQHLGTGALTLDLSEAEFRATLNAAILQVPHLQGVNNHMGSELTQHPQQMVWLMDELKRQGLYFVDSRTSKETVAARIAQEQRVANLSRQVFLDNERTSEAIEERFNAALAIARESGLAVVIGHPHRVTLEYLAQVLPGLAEQGIALASVSEVLSQQSQGNSPAGVITDSPEPEDEVLNEEVQEAQSLTSIPREAM